MIPGHAGNAFQLLKQDITLSNLFHMTNTHKMTPKILTNSIILHRSELSTNSSKFSIIALAETNLDSCNKDLFRLNGYISAYQSKCPGKKKGSGLAIYVKDSLLFSVEDKFSQCSKNLESLFITVSNTAQPVTIGVIYRPPSGSLTEFYTELNAILEKVPKSNVHLAGDFNIDLHKKMSINLRTLFMVMASHHLFQLPLTSSRDVNPPV